MSIYHELSSRSQSVEPSRAADVAGLVEQLNALVPLPDLRRRLQAVGPDNEVSLLVRYLSKIGLSLRGLDYIVERADGDGDLVAVVSEALAGARLSRSAGVAR